MRFSTRGCFQLLAFLLLTPSALFGQRTWHTITPRPENAHYQDLFFQDQYRGWACGNLGTLIATQDGGQRWTKVPIRSRQPFTQVLFTSPAKGWLLGRDTLFQTDNGGQTWRVNRVAPSGFYEVHKRMQFASPDTGWLWQHSRVYRTYNGGQTWKAIDSSRYFNDPAFTFLNARVGWTIEYPHLYRTYDGGITWKTDTVTNTAPVIGSDYTQILTGGKAWARASGNRVFYTADTGHTWSERVIPANVLGTNTVERHYFVDSLRGWVMLSKKRLARTEDGGITWTGFMLNGYTDLKVMDAFSLDGRRVWMVDNGGYIMFSPDGFFRTYNYQGFSLPHSTATVCFADANRGWAAGSTGALMQISYTTNGGLTWKPSSSVFTGYVYDMHFADALHGWVVGSNGRIVQTQDGGVTWQQHFGAGWNTTLHSVFFLNKRVGWACGSTQTLLQTTDGGATWSDRSSRLPSIFTTWNEVFFSDSLHGWVAGNSGTLARTRDGGATWTRHDHNWGNVTALAFADSLVGYMAGDRLSWNTYMAKTTDGGRTWFPLAQGPGMQADMVFTDSLHGWVTTGHRTFDGGRNWQATGNRATFYSLSLVNDSLVYGGAGYGYMARFGDPLGPIPEVPKYITGTVFADENADCVQNPATDAGMGGRMVRTQPLGYYGVTDSLGRYAIRVDSGMYQVSQLHSRAEEAMIRPVCPDTIQGHAVDFNGLVPDTLAGRDFANRVYRCPWLQVAVSSNRRRLCARNITSVAYANRGMGPAANAVVQVRVPRFVSLIRASAPYVFNPTDSTYEFSLGTLAAGQEGAISILDSVSCQLGIVGQQQCYEARITPHNAVGTGQCIPSPTFYDGSRLMVRGWCQGDLRYFSIRNHGDSMSQARSIRVYVDTTLALSDNIRIPANDSMVVGFRCDSGAMMRVEMRQDPRNPVSQTATAEVLCGSAVALPGVFAPADDRPSADQSCLPIRYSYDPNEKTATPAGVGSTGKIRAGSMLNYTLHFQNTGTDTAYAVVVSDTLSEHLDLSTLQIGASSHRFRFQLSGTDRPVLVFRFDGINLPDSNTNNLGSNGFVSYRIRTLADLANGTEIRNRAAIVFDLNDPILTNTTLHTINPFSSGSGRLDTAFVSVRRAIPGSLPQATVRPNPSQGLFAVQVAGRQPGMLEVRTIQGRRLMEAPYQPGHNALDLRAYGRGMYFLTLRSGGGSQTLKLVVE